MTQNMDVTRIGDFVFSIFDENGALIDKWPCSSVKLTLALNALTSATAVIGCGRVLGNIDDPMDHSAELLMKEVAARTEAGAPMIECDINEELDGKSTRIFTGVIVAATLVYKAGSTTNRAVRFECLNKACYLHMVPLGMTHIICGSYVISELTGHMIPPITQYGNLYSRKIDIGALCVTLNKEISGSADIAKRISYLIEGIVALSGASYDTEVDLLNENLDQINFKDYITCDYTLNRDLYERLPSNGANQAESNANSNTNDSRFNTIDGNFNKELGQYLLARLQGASVLEAVVGIITTPEYMLTLVPRLNGEMKLVPSKAWSNEPQRTLTFADLKSINSSVSPLAHIADPDVFIVNYSAALPMDSTLKIDGSPVALTGVYTRHEDFMKERKRILEDAKDGKMGELFANNRYKRRVYNAPTWMYDSFIGNFVGADQPKAQQQQAPRAQFIPDKNEQDPEKKEAATVYFDVNKGRQMADKFAEALFAFIHGRSNTAELELLPSLRFGMDRKTPLEDLVGELIDIKASDTMDKDLTKVTDDLLEIRGMVSAVTFSYDAGISASCTYSVHLTRVRPLVEKEDAINCPLYAPVNENKQEDKE